MMKNVTNGFEMFMKETNGVGQAFMDEIRSAILLPMPIVGLQVAEALPYINEEEE